MVTRAGFWKLWKFGVHRREEVIGVYLQCHELPEVADFCKCAAHSVQGEVSVYIRLTFPDFLVKKKKKKNHFWGRTEL